MPKLKTHRGAAKRFKLTKTGQVKCRRAYRNHILTKKSPTQKRRLRTGAVLAKVDVAKVTRLLVGS